MKKLINIFTLLVLSSSYSQHSIGTPPSPGTLGGSDIDASKYVDYATGTVGVSLPIMEIGAGEFKVPITLNYQSKGLEVENIASWVGAEWYLNAGGNISRTVVGYPDDDNSTSDGIGILHTPSLQAIANMNMSANEQVLGDAMYDMFMNKKDTQPDQFYLNIFGKTVKFIFDANNKIRTLENSNYSVTHTLDANGKIREFKVIDAYGNIYYFNELEATTETSSYSSYNYDAHEAQDEFITKTFTSSWRLKQIVTRGNKIINFNYRAETIEYDLKKLELQKICKNNDCNTYMSLSPEFITVRLSKIQVSSKVIKEIIHSDVKITFNQSGVQRQDLKGSYKLSSIVKSSSISGQLASYVLNSTYIQSSGVVDSQNPYKSYKLKLNSIFCNGQFKYQFNYNSVQPPNLHSPQQDFWGFYNGNNATSLIPTTYVYPNTSNLTSFYLQNTSSPYHAIAGANRQSNAYYAESGMLKSFSDDLGNNVTFDYELNKFVSNGVQFTGNGLRVKNVKFSGSLEYSYDKNIFYEDGGVNGFVELLPSFSYYSTARGIRYVINNNGVYHEFPTGKFKLQGYASGQGFPTLYAFYADGASNWTEYYKHFYATSRFSTPINASSRNEYSVNYLNVRETFGDMSKVYQYVRNTASTDFPSESDVAFPVIRRVRKLPEFQNVANPDVQAQTPYFWDNDFPYFPSYSRSWRPSLLTEVQYKAGNILIKKEVYEYDLISKLPSNRKIFGIKYEFLEKPTVSHVSPQYLLTKPNERYGFVFAKYPIITETEKMLKKQSTIEYADGQELEKSTEFFYNNRNLVSKKVSTDSEGRVEETLFKYPTDLWSVQQSTYGRMVVDNAVDYPVEITKKKDGKVVASEVNSYIIQSDQNPEGQAYFFTHLLKNKLILEISQPVSDFQPAVGNPGGAAFDSRMKVQRTNHAYDSYGNVISFSERGGAKTAIVYGYGKKLPIAKIEGLNIDNISDAIASNLEALSSQDNDNCRAPSCKEEILRIALNSLRASYPDAFVTTYTYDPHIGMTSSTDPKGYTMYYRYDSLQRLVEIKDADGNIVTSYDYHNKTQN